MAETSDPSSHRRDQIYNFAEILRNAAAKQKVFEAVYRGKKRSKTIGDIATATGYSTKRVAEIAGPLARGGKLFEQGRARHAGRRTTVYNKIDFVSANRAKILSLARNRDRLDSFHTKTNPKINVSKGHRVTVTLPFRIRSGFIRAEDIKEFAKTKNDRRDNPLKPARLPERKMKDGILKLLGETKSPKDWGGENNDIFTDRITLFGKKRRAAFALKGPAKSGPLVPKMMGKNGDQIQRLFDTPATVFLVQYEGEVKESIFKLMEELAKAKAVLGGEIFWGVLDDDATKRLRRAYPRAFGR
jgi:hypothetical protein